MSCTQSEIIGIKQKYPEHIPVIVKSKDKSINLQNTKFLVKNDITVGQFLFSIRRRCIKDLAPTDAIYMFVNDKIPPSSLLVSSLYQSLNVNDILEVFICKENTFG